jgi:hypothetical protein
MLHRALAVCAFALLAAPLSAQQPGNGFTPPPPPPDHWLTLDSLTRIVGLDATQRKAVSDPYTALNAVLKQAADRRAEMRRRFSGQPRPQSPQDITPEQRARFDSVRVEFQGMQEEADQWYQMIRDQLRADQLARFDALPKPVVARRQMQRGP